MKTLVLLGALFSLNLANAQCITPTEKMMVIGDSWAFFSWSGNSYNENLNRFGLSDVECYSTVSLAVNGAEASDYFTDPTRVTELKTYINSNPNLKAVHFSLGGNDMMGTWNNSMTNQQASDVLDVIFTDIKSGIDSVLAINPDLDILLSGYDFPNFSETVGALPALLQSQHPFYSTWTNMGQPTPTEINDMLIVATQRFIDSAAVWQNVSFVNNLGLMQNIYGQTNSSFGNYAANTAPVPGGFPDKPTPTEALNFSGNDSFHLNDASYELFIKRHFENYYWNYFRASDISFNADLSTNNGWLSSTTESNGSIKIGNDASNNINSILSFNTTTMPNDKQAMSASVYIQRSALLGSNITIEDLTVSIKTGFFGDNISLDAGDFNDAGAVSAVSCVYGDVSQDEMWLRIDLDPSLLPFINRYGTTQLKLSYNIPDSDRYIEFSNDVTKIMLDLKLEDAPVSVEEVELLDDVICFPNPTNSILNFNNLKENTNIIITDINGKVVLLNNYTGNKLNISSFDNGIYFLTLRNNDSIKTIKIVKN